ncbi:DUF222 domain-containing protein [Luteimicrobium sp. DT211]|uniref:DUF222 domain-containing protein n=1 Tax=Luteimicrobium sp. DT211 TaxID=3393412 RepID=UPI003CF4228B
MFESTGGCEGVGGGEAAARLPFCPPDDVAYPGAGTRGGSEAGGASVAGADAADAMADAAVADAVADAVVADAESVLEGALRRALGSLDGAVEEPVGAPERGGATQGPDASLEAEAEAEAEAVSATPAAPLELVVASAAPVPLDGGDPGSADLEGADPVAAFTDAALEGLEDVVPGPELAQVLAGLDVADVTDDALVEVVAAAERLRSWALAVQARAAGELADRAGGSSAAVDGAAAAVGARLCVTRRGAEGLLGLASGLAELPEVADALAVGRIDDRRARVLVEGCVDLPREHRRTVVADLVVGADGTDGQDGQDSREGSDSQDGRRFDGPATRLTATRLRERLRRAVVAFDPDGGARRRARARGDRNVRFEPAGECMAYLTALLPAADAARARAGLDALAVAAHRTPGESRTLDQVRADTLVALLSGARPVLVCGPGAPGAQTGPLGSVGAAGLTGGPELASSDAASSASASPDGARPHGATGELVDPLRDATRVAGWTAPTVRTVVHITVAASTLLGLDDLPGDLTGFGPIPADLARRLATGQDVTWQRIVTDPVTGIASDVSRRTYRPGTVLGDLVRVRDATCTFPGCGIPAWRADLDHVEPFDHDRTGAGPSGDGTVSDTGPSGGGPANRAGASGGTGLSGGTGQTRADNLHPVCRHHHNLKTHGGWSTTRDPVTGVVTWRSPTGHEHNVGPHVTDPDHKDAPASEGRRASARPEPHGVETHRARPRTRRTRPEDPGAPPDDDPPF